jgi:hypothetical protein
MCYYFGRPVLGLECRLGLKNPISLAAGLNAETHRAKLLYMDSTRVACTNSNFVW